MIHDKTLERFLVRAQQEIGAFGNFRTTHELVEAEAIAAARCSLVNAELDSFTNFCYQKEGEWFCNLSGNTQIPTGIWCPWGASGKGRLTRMERDTVRAWLQALNRGKALKPVYFYSPSSRRWNVDTLRYPTLESAAEWLTNNRIDGKTWLRIQARLRGHE